MQRSLQHAAQQVYGAAAGGRSSMVALHIVSYIHATLSCYDAMSAAAPPGWPT